MKYNKILKNFRTDRNKERCVSYNRGKKDGEEIEKEALARFVNQKLGEAIHVEKRQRDPPWMMTGKVPMLSFVKHSTRFVRA